MKSQIAFAIVGTLFGLSIGLGPLAKAETTNEFKEDLKKSLMDLGGSQITAFSQDNDLTKSLDISQISLFSRDMLKEVNLAAAELGGQTKIGIENQVVNFDPAKTAQCPKATAA